MYAIMKSWIKGKKIVKNKFTFYSKFTFYRKENQNHRQIFLHNQEMNSNDLMNVLQNIQKLYFFSCLQFDKSPGYCNISSSMVWFHFPVWFRQSFSSWTFATFYLPSNFRKVSAVMERKSSGKVWFAARRCRCFGLFERARSAESSNTVQQFEQW